MIDKQKLLHVGDVILEVNGIPVSTPEDLQTEVAKVKDHVTLKIGNAPTLEQPTHSNIVMANGTSNGVTKKLAVSIDASTNNTYPGSDCYMLNIISYVILHDILFI